MSEFWFEMGIAIMWLMALALGVSVGALAFMAFRFVLVEDDHGR
jgi:hypothetical protein